MAHDPRWHGLALLLLFLFLGGAWPIRTRAKAHLSPSRAACSDALPNGGSAAAPPDIHCGANDHACHRARCDEGHGNACFIAQRHSRGCELDSARSCAMVALQSSGSARRQAVEKACRLGDGPSCEMAASLRASSGDLTADPCYEAFIRRACALGVASSCTLARQCDPLAAASPPSAGAEIIAAFLRSTSVAAARAHVDPGFERTGVVLRLLAGPAARSATEVEALVDALLSAPDEDGAWASRPGCVVAPGRASDRDEVAPLLFQGAVSPRLQALVIRMRRRLDAAEAWVARCRCYPDEVFLLDGERGRIVASQAGALPELRSGLIRDAKADGRRDINLDSHPTGATLRWRGRPRRLPLRLEDVRNSELLGATLSADGHEPFTITAGALKQPVFREFGPEQTGEASWYFVLRPSRPAGGGGR